MRDTHLSIYEVCIFDGAFFARLGADGVVEENQPDHSIPPILSIRTHRNAACKTPAATLNFAKQRYKPLKWKTT